MSSERSFCKIRASYDELFIVIYRNRTYDKENKNEFVKHWSEKHNITPVLVV